MAKIKSESPIDDWVKAYRTVEKQKLEADKRFESCCRKIYSEVSDTLQLEIRPDIQDGKPVVKLHPTRDTTGWHIVMSRQVATELVRELADILGI